LKVGDVPNQLEILEPLDAAQALAQVPVFLADGFSRIALGLAVRAGDNAEHRSLILVSATICGMFEYRVTKYDPAHRAASGAYRDEWTSFSDIGRSFGGVILTVEQYQRIEDADHYCGI
jgi:hypothetical protein